MKPLALFVFLSLCLVISAAGQAATQGVLYVFENKHFPGSLLTMDRDEAYRLNNLYSKDWQQGLYMGIASSTPATDMVPVYRYFQPKTEDHFFTTDAAEGADAVKYLQYSSEGICCYIFPSAAVAQPHLQGENQPILVRRYVDGNHHAYGSALSKKAKEEGPLGFLGFVRW